MIHVFQQAILDILVYRNVHAMFKAMGGLPLNVLSGNPVFQWFKKLPEKGVRQGDFRKTLFFSEISISRSPKFSSEFTYWIYSYLNPKKKRDRLPVPACFFRGQAVKGLGCVGSTCQSSVWNYLHRTPLQNDLWTPLVEHPWKSESYSNTQEPWQKK